MTGKAKSVPAKPRIEIVTVGRRSNGFEVYDSTGASPEVVSVARSYAELLGVLQALFDGKFEAPVLSELRQEPEA